MVRWWWHHRHWQILLSDEAASEKEVPMALEESEVKVTASQTAALRLGA